MPDVDLAAFRAYDLGLMLDDLRAYADHHPTAPARHVVWGSAQDRLPWDHRWATCWDDPSFLPRYEWLRDATCPEAGTELPEAIRLLEALVTTRQAAEDEEPF